MLGVSSNFGTLDDRSASASLPWVPQGKHAPPVPRHRDKAEANPKHGNHCHMHYSLVL